MTPAPPRAVSPRRILLALSLVFGTLLLLTLPFLTQDCLCGGHGPSASLRSAISWLLGFG